jgi:hypothetical protein
VQEDEVAPTKPKVDSLIAMTRKRWEQKHSKGATNQRSRKQSTRIRGKEDETKNTPAKASLTSASPKKTKRVWSVNGVSFESSTLGPDESKIN